MPVVVEGIVSFRRAMIKLAPDIKKEMDKEIREALKPVIQDARSKVPASAPGGLYNYNYPGYERTSRIKGKKRAFPSYDSAAIRRGLTYTLGTRRLNNNFVSLFTLLNKSASGAIIETAGRKNPGGDPESRSNNPNAGRRFINSMNGVGGLVDYAGRGRESTGRLLYAAYARNKGKALDATMKAIDKAKATFAARVVANRKAA